MNSRTFKSFNRRKFNNTKNTIGKFGFINGIEIIIKLSPIFSLLALVFGGVVTFTYLESIEQTAIFPDILTSPYALLALMAVFLILSFGIICSLITPYLLSEYMTKDIHFTGKNIKNPPSTTHYINVIISSVIFIFIWFLNITESIGGYLVSLLGFILFLFYIHNKLKKNIDPLLLSWMDLFLHFSIFFAISFAISAFIDTQEFSKNMPYHLKYLPTVLMFVVLCRGIYVSSGIKLSYFFDKLDNFFIITFIPLSFLFSTLWLIMMALQIADSGYQNNNVAGQIVLLLLCVIWLIIYSWNGYIAFDLYEKNQKIQMTYLIFPMILFFGLIYTCVYLDKSRQLQRFILKPLHFIEYPSDSNWYTIDTRFFAPNNLSEAEIKKNSDELKKFFKLPEKTQCTYLPEILEDNEDNQKKPNKAECLQLEKQFQNENKYNRFYGYVAWNLGEMKVFCPYGYEKTQENKDKSKKIKCLALKSEYIIPYY